jgi:hypothetical protein
MTRKPVEDYTWRHRDTGTLRLPGIAIDLSAGEFVLAILSGPLSIAGSQCDMVATSSEAENGGVILRFPVQDARTSGGDLEPGTYQFSQLQVRRGHDVVREYPVDDFLHIYVHVVDDAETGF